MKNRKNAFMIMMVLLIMTFMVISTKEVSAKVRFNKTSKTVRKGKSYTLKITGVKLKKIKKVTLKYDKKIVKVKRIKKNSYKITGKKKGKTTLRATVKYRKIDNSKGTKRLKCKISVKNKNTKKDKETYDKPGMDDNNSGTIEDYPTTDYGQSIDKFLSSNKSKDIYKLNDYTIYDGERADGAGYYGIIINHLYHDIDWYSKKEYDEIISEAERIVKECKISDDMTDQEKVYRIGRNIIFNIDYVVGCNIHKIHDALFKKQTVCSGYSTTFAFLCRYIGIDCSYVRSESHAWNLVKLGDYYYVSDLTGAYFSKSVNEGVWDMFRESDYSSSMSEIWEEYKIISPVDSIDYYTRCKNEGISYLTGRQLTDRCK